MSTKRKPTGHELALAWALSRTSGPVLEMGSGWGSTPFLHAVCHGARKLVTLETNPDWLAKFAHLNSKWHTLKLVDRAWSLPLLDQRWAVALVDQAPSRPRGECIERLRAHTDYIIAHDWDWPKTGDPDRVLRAYGYLDLKPFKHHFLDASCKPYTMVLSDLRPIGLVRAI